MSFTNRNDRSVEEQIKALEEFIDICDEILEKTMGKLRVLTDGFEKTAKDMHAAIILLATLKKKEK